MSEIPILYNYVPYEQAKKGVFSITTDEYKLPGGWVLKEEERIIIGETDDCFVEKLLESGHGEWIGDKVVQLNYTLPVGIHKSRFVKWLPTQIEINY